MQISESPICPAEDSALPLVFFHSVKGRTKGIVRPIRLEATKCKLLSIDGTKCVGKGFGLHELITDDRRSNDVRTDVRQRSDSLPHIPEMTCDFLSL